MRKFYVILVLMLATFGAANADVVYTDIEDVTLSSGGSIGIDFNSDNTDEFTFEDMGFDDVEPGIMFADDNTYLATVSVDEWDVLEGINLNTVIDASSGWNAQGDAYIDPFWGTTPFPSGEDTYLGAKFNLGTNTHFGWIRVNWNGAGTFIIKDFAYNDTPNAALNAGEMANTEVILVNSITVQSVGNVSAINGLNQNLQMSATVMPQDASNLNYEWSVENGTGQATINPNGLLSTIAEGLVTVKATALDASNTVGTFELTITNEMTLVSSINIQTPVGDFIIDVPGGNLQMQAYVLPGNATDNSVSWEVENETGSALISSGGILSAATDGTVLVKAMANDASGIVGSVQVTISNQTVSVAELDAHQLHIYPNPAQDQLTIDQYNTFEFEQFNIYNAQGQLVYVEKLKSGIETLDLSALKTGIYVMVLNKETGESHQEKLIVK